MPSRRDEAEHLAERAEEFLRTAEYQMESGFYGLAAFSLEQSLQLFLKAKLLERGVEYPRTHSVRKLLEMLSEVGGEGQREMARGLLERYLLELGALEDAYITSRYIAREFRKEEVERLRGVVEEVMRNVA
ncbi:MAG: HEPN domain-containing protein [Candidatus Bathyarchaeia archaeon]